MNSEIKDMLKKGTQSYTARVTMPETQGVTVPRVSSDELLAGHKEIIIVHGEGEYRLRETKQGRLILTK